MGNTVLFCGNTVLTINNIEYTGEKRGPLAKQIVVQSFEQTSCCRRDECIGKFLCNKLDRLVRVPVFILKARRCIVSIVKQLTQVDS